jgi:hypothetical protein
VVCRLGVRLPMKYGFEILLFLPLIIMLSGCTIPGSYSRVELRPTDSGAFLADTHILQKEVGNTLATLGFQPLKAGQAQPTSYITDWMLQQENLSLTNCVAEWFSVEKQSFWWGGQTYCVEMFVEKDVMQIVLTSESGSQMLSRRTELEKIQAVLTKMIADKFPNLKIHVVFRRLVQSMGP